MPPDFNTNIPVNPAEKKMLNLTIYPNPTSEIVFIKFEIPNPSPVSILVFNAVGQQVAELQEGLLPKGKHIYSQNTNHWPTGLYFLHALSGDEIVTRKIVKY
jgi:hypothetical protein